MYDRGSGPLLPGSVRDYFLPRPGFIRDIKINEHPVPSKLNVLGAKAWRIGLHGFSATLANTLDALRPLRIQHLISLTPEASCGTQSGGKKIRIGRYVRIQISASQILSEAARSLPANPDAKRWPTA